MKNEFELNPEVEYLNTGTLSLVPKSIMKAHVQELYDYEKNPTANLFAGWGRLWDVQKKVAPFLGAKPEDFFFRHNVTGAMNDFILGVKLPAGDIATTDLEYGAITNICRFRCQKENRKLITVAIPNENTIESEDALIDSILSQLPSSVKLLMLSHVMTGAGLRIPIEKLGKKLKERGIIFAVDGAHGAGAFKVDFSKFEGIQFYGGNLHKWMLGPKGTGFGWVPAGFQDQLEVIQAGWTTFETPPPFVPFGNGNRFASKMLMSNCLSFPTFFVLKDLIEWWEIQGVDKIHAQLQHLRKNLEAVATENKWSIVSPKLDSLKSPLLALEVKPEYAAKPLDTLNSVLNKTGLQITMSPWRGSFVLRLSAHVYADESRFVSAFEKLDYLRK
ncbi:MAG: aminotransferase class V-fold PLP-dependent enzyme [Bdellovibrionota bacterium]